MVSVGFLSSLLKNDSARLPRIDAFELGQLLWICSLGFSYFGSDLRRGLALLALFFLYKSKKHLPWSEIVDQNGKWVIGVFCLFWCWITLIPLFGAGGVKLGFRSMADPIEVIVCLLITLSFAQDPCFFRRMYKIILFSAFLFFTIMLTNRYMQGFTWEPRHWILSRTSAHAGAFVCFFIPWIFLGLCKTRKINMQWFFLILLICEAIALLVMTFSSTFWLAFAVQFLLFSTLIFFRFKRKFVFCVSVAVLFCVATAAVAGLNHLTDGQIVSQMKGEYTQLTAVGTDLRQFTTNRDIIWKNTVKLIAMHPVTGWSWKNFHEVSFAHFEGETPELILRGSVTPHSSYLSAAWCTGIPGLALYLAVLLILLAKSLKELTKGAVDVAFVVLILLTGYAVAGFAEDLFAWELRLMVPTWCVFATIFVSGKITACQPVGKDRHA